jgi:hypothetical protein
MVLTWPAPYVRRASSETLGLDPLKLKPPDYLEWRCDMKKLLAVVTLAAVIMTSPALAQSYDPDIGSGNIAPAASHPYGN